MASSFHPVIIVVSGPTAVGKTTASVKIAKEWNAEIISADSRQIYKEMRIGTSPPPPELLKEVPHHWIGNRSIFENYSAGDYEREVIAFLRDYFQQRPVVLLTGGTQFYIKAILSGLDRFPEVATEIKSQVARDLRVQGIEYLQEELREKDPLSYREIDRKNPRRLCRAIEIIRQSDRPFSEFKQQTPKSRFFRTVKIALNRPRQELYDRINRRVDLMVQRGLEAEAKQLFPHRDRPALNTVGYREWFDHFEGQIDRSTAIEKIKQHTRNYAKRQLTWLRNEEGWLFYHPDQLEELISDLHKHPLIQSIPSHFRGDGQ